MANKRKEEDKPQIFSKFLVLYHDYCIEVLKKTFLLTVKNVQAVYVPDIPSILMFLMR